MNSPTNSSDFRPHQLGERPLLSEDSPISETHADLVLREILGDWQGAILLGQLCALTEEKGISPRRSLLAIMRLAAGGTLVFDGRQPISPSTTVVVFGASRRLEEAYGPSPEFLPEVHRPVGRALDDAAGAWWVAATADTAEASYAEASL